MKHVNTDVHRRRWITLQGPDGRTLELDPGQVVDLPEPIDDPYLKPVESTARRRGRTSADGEPADTTPSEPAAADASGKED